MPMPPARAALPIFADGRALMSPSFTGAEPNIDGARRRFLPPYVRAYAVRAARLSRAACRAAAGRRYRAVRCRCARERAPQPLRRYMRRLHEAADAAAAKIRVRVEMMQCRRAYARRR